MAGKAGGRGTADGGGGGPAHPRRKDGGGLHPPGAAGPEHRKPGGRAAHRNGHLRRGHLHRRPAHRPALLYPGQGGNHLQRRWGKGAEGAAGQSRRTDSAGGPGVVHRRGKPVSGDALYHFPRQRGNRGHPKESGIPFNVYRHRGRREIR